jgi:hypothetical protein
MKRMAFLACTILAGAAMPCLVFNCSRQVAGSGGTDYPNTRTLAGVVNTGSGAAVPGARVYLVENQGWLGDVVAGISVVLDSATCDARGEFSVALPLRKSWNIQIDSRLGGILMKDYGDTYDTLDTDKRIFGVLPYASVSGKFTADSEPAPRDLRFGGSAYVAPVNEDRSYSLAAMAPGDYTVITETGVAGNLQPALAASLTAVSGTSRTGVDISVPVNRIIVDDFSIGRERTNLGRLIGGGGWFTADDSPEGGNSSISFNLVSGPGAYDGQSMLARFALGTTPGGPLVILGFFIGDGHSTTTYDFSGVKSLSFWARGKGNVEVRFYTRILDTLRGNEQYQFSCVIPMPAFWTHVTIPVDSLRIPSTCAAYREGYTWKQVAGSMQAIDFLAKYPDNNPGDSVVLYLDDISLEGIGLATFAP